MDLRHPRRGGFNRRFGASSMRDETSDEYAGAFQRFVTNLVVQRSIPSQSRTSRKDVKLPKDGAERVAKTPMLDRTVVSVLQICPQRLQQHSQEQDDWSQKNQELVADHTNSSLGISRSAQFPEQKMIIE